MFPSIYLFGKSIFLYDVFCTLGTVLGLALSMAIMIKTTVFNKKAVVAYLVSLAVSYPFASVLRHIMEMEITENIFKQFLKDFAQNSGSHFMGMFFAFYFIFPLVYDCILKIKPNDKIRCVACVYFAIQHFFSRLGCYSLGCCFGREYNGVFAITFPYGSNPYNVYGRETAIFPTQLFEMFFMLVLLTVLLFNIKNNKNGYAAAVIIFSVAVFVSEIFIYRYDFEITPLGLTLPQLCAVVLVVTEAVRSFVSYNLIKNKINAKQN